METKTNPTTSQKAVESKAETRPLISLVIPVYNESAILKESISKILDYLKLYEEAFLWEILLIDDGSKDSSGRLADELANENQIIRVIHHIINMNLGSALRTGFVHSRGEYIVTLDLDLSYGVEYIGKLLTTIIQTQADIVLASPYMKGGKVMNVPFLRRAFSRMANRYMSMVSQEKYYTFTAMVRAYKGDYIRSLNLKARSAAINPEIIYKSIILRAIVVEIPAVLDWSFQNKYATKRVSSIKIFKSVLSGLMSGFIFRPYVFFLTVGMILLLLSVYVLTWIFINTMQIYPKIVASSAYFDDRFSNAIAEVFKQRPHAFFIGGFVLVIALQFIGIGFLSLQNKRYFEETFHINTRILKQTM
jgi:glycosyltransferase involved in cell wall biosynthesis